jgi:hypothetical protein
MEGWLILIYKIPPEPSRLRAGIWRKLKAAGAIYCRTASRPSQPARRVSALCAGSGRRCGGWEGRRSSSTAGCRG